MVCIKKTAMRHNDDAGEERALVCIKNTCTACETKSNANFAACWSVVIFLTAAETKI